MLHLKASDSLGAFSVPVRIVVKIQFHRRPVYMASSWMAPVGRYNGKDKDNRSFLEMAERCSSVFLGYAGWQILYQNA